MEQSTGVLITGTQCGKTTLYSSTQKAACQVTAPGSKNKSKKPA
ncbi:TPA: hypothetical protein ACNIQM_001512 [Citrobacter werkmanii]|nr:MULTISPECIES: hypothetical protein [Citrobacter]